MTKYTFSEKIRLIPDINIKQSIPPRYLRKTKMTKKLPTQKKFWMYNVSSIKISSLQKRQYL